MADDVAKTESAVVASWREVVEAVAVEEVEAAMVEAVAVEAVAVREVEADMVEAAMEVVEAAVVEVVVDARVACKAASSLRKVAMMACAYAMMVFASAREVGWVELASM